MKTDNTTRILRGVVAIERPPLPLPVPAVEKTAAQALGRAVSVELAAALSASDSETTVPQAELALAAALYEPAELLQPGFALHEHLLRYLQAATSGAENKGKLLTIGTNARGELPEALEQNSSPRPGPLLLMPFVLTTADAGVSDRFESQLMDRGLLSARTTQQLSQALNTPIEHANFLSLLDLAAMMRAQFEHAGFLPEWEIIEAALLSEQPQLRQHSPFHNDYFLYRQMVFTPFFSYDFWAAHGPGREMSAKYRRQAWLGWLQHQRQAVAVMQSHGLDVRQYLPRQWPEPEQKICLGDINQQVVKEDFFTEIHSPIDESRGVTVTEQHIPGLGTVAYTLSQNNGSHLQHLYPLTPSALDAIPRHLQSLFGEHLRLNVVNELRTNKAAERLIGGWNT